MPHFSNILTLFAIFILIVFALILCRKVFLGKRTWHGTVIQLGLAIVSIIVLLLFNFGTWPPLLDLADIPALETQGDLIVEKLESFKQLNLHYPDSLKEVLGAVPVTKYGEWHYIVGDDHKTFILWIGNYDYNLFNLTWSQALRKWVINS